jgi:hypothetical protein
MFGRLGLRVKVVAGAPSFVQRRLPRAGSHAELTFDINPRRFSTAGAWVEIAVIAGSRGQRLASVDLRSHRRGGDQIRLSSSTGTGAIVHSPLRSIRRRPTALVLSLGPTHATLAVDGAALGRLGRAPGSPQAAAVALGPWRAGPPASTGYLDIDRVTVRQAPATS